MPKPGTNPAPEDIKAFLKDKLSNFKIPEDVIIRPDEIVGLAVYLASGASDYMTGQTLFLDGGYAIST
jgi:NAD(P)-dependent dehydrogenase (short-subunit alcohol dehydrogenase family)